MRRKLTILAAIPLAVLLLCNSVWAGGGIDGDSIVADVSSTAREVVPGPTVPPVICEWGSDQVHFRNGRSESGEYRYTYIDLLYWRFRPATGEIWVQSMRICRQDGVQVSSGLEWRPVSGPDPEVLADTLYDEVTEQVPLPRPDLSPVGPGFVNLGMWLAVEEPAPISVTARAGAVWATTTASLESTTFDMGDGTVVTCDGAGDPIPDSKLDSVDESDDCGHTYTTLGPDGEPFTVTITSTWHVTWVGSGGTGGDLGTLDRTSSVEYEVLEIQTVGTGN